MALLQAIERAVRISKKGLPSLTKAARLLGAPQIVFKFSFILNQHNNQRDYRPDCRHNPQHGNTAANVPSARPAVRPSVRSARSAWRGRCIVRSARPHRPWSSCCTGPSRSSRPRSAGRRSSETSSSHKVLLIVAVAAIRAVTALICIHYITRAARLSNSYSVA